MSRVNVDREDFDELMSGFDYVEWLADRGIPMFIFLCDGNKECHKSLFCYMNGGECKHTSSRKHSKNGYGLDKKPDIKDFEEETGENNLIVYFEKED